MSGVRAHEGLHYAVVGDGSWRVWCAQPGSVCRSVRAGGNPSTEGLGGAYREVRSNRRVLTMRGRTVRRVVCGVVGLTGVSAGTAAQCEVRVRPHLAWSVGTGRLQSAVFGDGGDGARLFVVGDLAAPFGDPDVFTGEQWPRYGYAFAALRDGAWRSPPGTMLFSDSSYDPQAMAFFDDGTGPALYVGGYDRYWWTEPPHEMRVLARVQGSTVTQVGPFDPRTLGGVGSASVRALKATVIEGVPTLLIGGWFAGAQGVASRSIIAWDGGAFHPMGQSLFGPGVFGTVNAIEVYDGGAGREVYAAGSLYESQPEPTSLGVIARLRNGAWESISPYDVVGPHVVSSEITSLRVHDDGRGERLWAAGEFRVYVKPQFERTVAATWDGGSWWFAPTMMEYGKAHTMGAIDLGEGERLFFGGDFGTYPSNDRRAIVEWTGQAWRGVGGGMGSEETVAKVRALTSAEIEGERVLVAAGEFTVAGGRAVDHLASWDGASWRPVGPVLGPDGAITASVVSSIGGAPALYAAGGFQNVGETALSRFARWDGERWTGIAGLPQGAVHTMVEYDADGAGGSPTTIVVGGSFPGPIQSSARNVAMWVGAGWLNVGEGFNGTVHRLRVLDPDGPAGPLARSLIACGSFTASGSRPMSRVARWNGGAWEALGPVINNTVFDVGVFDLDGDGPAPETLVIAGQFSYVNGEPAQGSGDLVRGVAQLIDGRWEPVGQGLYTTVRALEVFDADGNGPRAPSLFAGGSLFIVGASGTPASSVVRWNGSGWEPSSMAAGETFAFAQHDDDGGGLGARALYGLGAGATGLRRMSGGVWGDAGAQQMRLGRTMASVGVGFAGARARLVVMGERMVFAGVPSYFAELIGCDGGCAGDTNGDLRVDMVDLVAVLGSFGAGSGVSTGDVNGDGVVDFLDLNIVLSAFGTEC